MLENLGLEDLGLKLHLTFLTRATYFFSKLVLFDGGSEQRFLSAFSLSVVSSSVTLSFLSQVLLLLRSKFHSYSYNIHIVTVRTVAQLHRSTVAQFYTARQS